MVIFLFRSWSKKVNRISCSILITSIDLKYTDRMKSAILELIIANWYLVKLESIKKFPWKNCEWSQTWIATPYSEVKYTSGTIFVRRSRKSTNLLFVFLMLIICRSSIKTEECWITLYITSIYSITYMYYFTL